MMDHKYGQGGVPAPGAGDQFSFFGFERPSIRNKVRMIEITSPCMSYHKTPGRPCAGKVRYGGPGA